MGNTEFRGGTHSVEHTRDRSEIDLKIEGRI